jgi:hypothetical protein
LAKTAIAGKIRKGDTVTADRGSGKGGAEAH